MSSMSGGQKTDSVNSGKLRTEYGNNRMIVNDGTDDILLAGQDNDGDIVFKVSQPGFDVKTATNQQLAFSSQFNTLKIIQTGTVTLNKAANSTDAFTSVTHGLGYRPVVLCFADGGTFGLGNILPVRLVMTQTGATPADCAEVTDAELRYGTTTSVVNFFLSTPNWSPAFSGRYSNAITANVKYYIMAETGA